MENTNENNTSLIHIGSTGLVSVKNSISITNKILAENRNRYLNSFAGTTFWSTNLFNKMSIRDIINYDEKNEIIVAGNNGIIYFLSKKGGTITNQINIGNPIYKLCLVKNEKINFLYAGVMSGELFKIELNDNLNYTNFKTHNSAISGILYSQKFNFIITTSTDGYIKIWDILKNVLINSINAHVLTESIAISNNILISAGLSGEIKFVSLPNLHFINEYKGNRDKEFEKKVAINSKLNRRAVGSFMESTIQILDLNNLKILNVIELNIKFAIGDLCYSSDDKFLCAACSDGTVKIFDAVNHDLLLNYKDHISIANKEIEKTYGGNRVLAALFDTNNKNLFTGDMSGNINYWG
jgi:WD40 repeat protein